MKLIDIVLFGVLGFTACSGPRQLASQNDFSCYPKPILAEIDSFYANKNKRLYELKTLSDNCIYYESIYDSSSVSVMNTPLGWQRIYRCKDSLSITPITEK